MTEPRDPMCNAPSAPAGWAELRTLTPARIGLGRAGASLTTRDMLDLTLDHARARDAVHAPFDTGALALALGAQGREALLVTSQAGDRAEYLRRPDLGRVLAAELREFLARHGNAPCDIAVVIGDGLSPAAVTAHAAKLLRAILDNLGGLTAMAPIAIAPIVIARGARVALGDDIGALLQARMTIMLIGERPGLSAPRSVGGYLTFAPKPGLTDADRNCVSNIQPSGLSVAEAAARIAWLVCEALRRGVTGVALKDESALQGAYRVGRG